MLMRYPNNLRQIREERRVTQPELAKALADAGIINPTKQKVAKLEKGEQPMSAKEAAVFASVLKCTTDDLLSTEPTQRRIQQALISTADTPTRGLDPYDEALLAQGKIISICRALSPEAKKEIDPIRFVSKILETLGVDIKEQPKLSQSLKKRVKP